MTATLKTSVIKEASSSVDNITLGSSGQVGLGGANYGTSGQVIISGGASAAPAWGNVVTSARETVIASTGNYTPNANGLAYSVVAIGGGGGGNNAASSNNVNTNGPGGSGGGSIIVTLTKADVGNSAISVTIGAGGNNTNAGGATSFGSIITANGGGAGTSGGGTASSNAGTVNTNKTGNTGSGNAGGYAILPYSGPTFGEVDASSVGAGGGPVTANAGSGGATGHNGFQGIVVVTEYL